MCAHNRHSHRHIQIHTRCLPRFAWQYSILLKIIVNTYTHTLNKRCTMLFDLIFFLVQFISKSKLNLYGTLNNFQFCVYLANKVETFSVFFCLFLMSSNQIRMRDRKIYIYKKNEWSNHLCCFFCWPRIFFVHS